MCRDTYTEVLDYPSLMENTEQVRILQRNKQRQEMAIESKMITNSQ